MPTPSRYRTPRIPKEQNERTGLFREEAGEAPDRGSIGVGDKVRKRQQFAPFDAVRFDNSFGGLTTAVDACGHPSGCLQSVASGKPALDIGMPRSLMGGT